MAQNQDEQKAQEVPIWIGIGESHSGFESLANIKWLWLLWVKKMSDLPHLARQEWKVLWGVCSLGQQVERGAVLFWGLNI
jgi:hypothetical protein